MVIHILMYLHPGDCRWDWSTNWKDAEALLNFAFTNRAMFDIAVPLIWRWQDDLTFLLRLLPRVLYHKEPLFPMDLSDLVYPHHLSRLFVGV